MNNEKIYFEQKKNNIINIVNSFREEYGDWAFCEVNQNNFDLEKLFCNEKLCNGCGECCATAPCVFSPYDFLDICDIDYMRNILNTGLISISRSSKCSDILVLRPRGSLDERFVVSKRREANNCILENGNGCLLPPLYRPCEGLLYIPCEGCGYKEHFAIYSSQKYTTDYKSYQDVLNVLAREYRDKPVSDYCSNLEERTKVLVRNLTKGASSF